MGFFLATQKRVRNSRGKRAISVRATAVLLYIVLMLLRASMWKGNICWPTAMTVEISLKEIISQSD